MEDLLKLVHLACTREKRVLQIHLGHNAPRCENIRVYSIVMRAQYALRSSVPPRRNVGSMRSALNCEVLARAEVDDLCDQGVLVHHDVIGLKITVQDPELFV